MLTNLEKVWSQNFIRKVTLIKYWSENVEMQCPAKSVCIFEDRIIKVVLGHNGYMIIMKVHLP